MRKGIFYGPALLASYSVNAQNEAEVTRETIKKSTIEGHIYFLAADELKGRETGTPEIDIAAQYLATTLRRFGVKPVPGTENGYFQSVFLETVKPATYKKLTTDSFETVQLIMMAGGNIDTTYEVVFVGYGSEKDY